MLPGSGNEQLNLGARLTFRFGKPLEGAVEISAPRDEPTSASMDISPV
jgi:hypothetical protein